MLKFSIFALDSFKKIVSSLKKMVCNEIKQ